VTVAAIVAVIAPLPRLELRGSERVAMQREHARRALALSARDARAPLDVLAHDERGAPRPSNGWHWSLSHSRSWVAACVNPGPVGIDVEELRSPRVEVVERALSSDESARFDLAGTAGFTRAWTAKEAVLKLLGIGLPGLAECRIVARLGDDTLELDWRGLRHRVRSEVTERRVVSVATRLDDEPVTVAWFEHAAPLEQVAP
jgi:4'-phosphopantetheinyl transferase